MMENKDYIVVGNIAVIDDEKGKKVVPNFKKLGAILAKQNLLEYIKKEKKECFIEKETIINRLTEKRSQRVNIINLVIFFVFALNLSFPISIGALLLIFISNIDELNTFFKKRKVKNGFKLANLYLDEKELEKEEQIEELKKESKEVVEERTSFYNTGFSIVKVPSNLDSEIDINYKRQFYYDYAYNKKKYMLYYKLGILRKRLEKKYRKDEDITKMEEFILYDAFKSEDDKLTRERRIFKK